MKRVLLSALLLGAALMVSAQSKYDHYYTNLPIEIESVEENLKDVAGVRVVCSFIDDIYRIEECFLAQEDVTLIERKDYIKNPKPSGYRSLHLIVKTPIYTENGKRICSSKSRCGRSPWISGLALSTSCGIRRILIRKSPKSWPKS